jgi:hypothetical protein
MDAPPILFDSDAELVRARALVDQLWNRAPPVTGTAYPLAFCRGSADSPASARYCAGDRWPLTYSVTELAHVVQRSAL